METGLVPKAVSSQLGKLGTGGTDDADAVSVRS